MDNYDLGTNDVTNNVIMQLVKNFEGFREQPYLDTRGIPTVGYGFNIAANRLPYASMTQDEAEKLFIPIYNKAVLRAMDFAGDAWGGLNNQRRATLIDMAYNLGDKLFAFKNMRAGVTGNNPDMVKNEMKNSKWYGQVGNRSRYHYENW